MKTNSADKKTVERYDEQHLMVYFNEQELPAPGIQTEGEQTDQVLYGYDALVIEATEMTADTIKAGLMANGIEELRAAVIAADVIFYHDGANDIAKAKALVTAKIMEYDSSEAVNQLTIGNRTTWIPREYREMFSTRLEQEVRRGHEQVTLNLPDAMPGDEPLTLNVNVARAMLDQLNDYATDCYDNTQAHIRALNALTALESVLAYDYTTGYPEKLSFELPTEA